MTRPQTTQLLGIIGIILLASNAFFFLTSGSYANDHLMPAQTLLNARVAFAVSSMVIGGLSFAAAQQPKLVGHSIGFVLAAASIAGSIASRVAKMPWTLGTTLFVIGIIVALLTIRSLRGSRVAWSFLVAHLAVMAVVTLFGAPKIRNVMHIPLWYAILIPGVLLVGMVALTLVRRDYRDVAPQTAAS